MMSNSSNSTKNLTRLSSIMGTWTIEANMKKGGNKLEAHFIMHLTCNSQTVGCNLDDCSEMDNDVCTLNETSYPSCHRMNETTVDWSDVKAFFYFGLKIDAGFPFNKHLHQNTGGWVGPYSIILAQDFEKPKYNESIADSYTAKYVYSPTTKYLKFPKDCDIMGYEDFDVYFGEGAVQHTVQTQATSRSIDDDFYTPYLETCDNGDVMSILPRVEIDFTHNDDLNININYKILTFPPPDGVLYWLFPKLIKRHKYPISGPYCYHDDPNRGFTIDLNYSTDRGSKYVNLHHSCVDDLPCIPPSVEWCTSCNASRSVFRDDSSSSSSDDSTTTADIPWWCGPPILISLSVALLLSLALNLFLRRRIQQKKCNKTKSCSSFFCGLEFEASEDEKKHYLLFQDQGNDGGCSI